MTVWLKCGLIAIAIITVFTAGFYTKGKFDQAAQEQALQSEINARIATEKKYESIANSYEAYKLQSHPIITNLLQKARTHAKYPATCRLDADSLHEIRAARLGASTR